VELKGERTLPVSRERAWAALNDIDALKAAVPGCESFVATGEKAYDVVVNAAIGPVKARFKGKIELADVRAPESYAIRFDMQGGAAGFSRGGARVRLETVDAHSTRMLYDVNASVGGKIAQIGSRLVDAASATMADRFFSAFAADLAAKYPAPAGAPVVVVARPGFFATLWAFFKRLFGGS
jgi:carbon monoxide dehydrogenase subunit G